jgi:hypothetical protein
MTTKTKPLSLAALGLQAELPPSPWQSPPRTQAERLQRIESMGQRLTGYIRFICQVESLNGSSPEAKDRAVTAFYERLLTLESQLRRIQEELRLG